MSTQAPLTAVESERAAESALALLSLAQRDLLCAIAGAPILRRLPARPTYATWQALKTLDLITGGREPTPLGLAVIALLHPEATMPTHNPPAAPQLPDNVRPVGSYQVSLQHGPAGYQAYAYGGWPARVVARSPWLADPAAALTDLAAAIAPNFARAAARDLNPPHGD